METINSHLIEFGYEMLAVIPYAYYLNEKGYLKQTVSAKDTKELYYFSPRHYEMPGGRDWGQMGYVEDIPNINIHGNFDFSRWSPPPYKKEFFNQEYDFELSIINKYASEWGGPPVNYIDFKTLEKLFASGKKIFYNRLLDPDYSDHCKLYDLYEFELIKEYPNVTTIQDFCKAEKLTYNQAQLLVYGACKRFISVQGGGAVIASYFGGTNIIFCARGQEIQSGAYYKVYPRLSNAEIIPVCSYPELLRQFNKDEFYASY